MQNKLIVTKFKDYIVSGLLDENSRFLEINLERGEDSRVLGNIYIGKVENIIENINAGFIEFTDRKVGYYNIASNPSPIILNRKTAGQLRAGDELIVQVAKDAVKTKEPVLSSNIELCGKYVILTVNKYGTAFSKKFLEKSRKQSIKEILEPLATKADYGLIVRTNAAVVADKDIFDEAAYLDSLWTDIKNKASFRTKGSLLYQSPQTYLSFIRDIHDHETAEIVTDDEVICESIREYLMHYQTAGAPKLTFYTDPLLPLGRLYNIEKCIEELSRERVWLKSGAYLVIQPTEALVVIDVNSGKNSSSRKVKDQFFKINLEAAKEIAHQIRLRNLSGIIIVDFINMDLKSHKEALIKEFDQYLKMDRIKTTLVDMTGLDLVEITRKKVRKPIYEQLF